MWPSTTTTSTACEASAAFTACTTSGWPSASASILLGPPMRVERPAASTSDGDARRLLRARVLAVARRRAAAGGSGSRPAGRPHPCARSRRGRPAGRRRAAPAPCRSRCTWATWRSPAGPAPACRRARPVSSRLPGSTGMPKWMTLPPACSMPAGTTSWRSTIAEAPAIRIDVAALRLQLLERAGDGGGVVRTAALADQRAAERGQPLAGRADRLVQHLVARAGQPGLHQAGAHRLERRDGDHRLVGRLARPRWRASTAVRGAA